MFMDRFVPAGDVLYCQRWQSPRVTCDTPLHMDGADFCCGEAQPPAPAKPGGCRGPPASTRVGAEHRAGHGEEAAVVPIPVLAAHRLLLQENTTCNIWGNTTDYRRTPADEDLSRTPHLVSAFVGLILALG